MVAAGKLMLPAAGRRLLPAVGRLMQPVAGRRGLPLGIGRRVTPEVGRRQRLAAGQTMEVRQNSQKEISTKINNCLISSSLQVSTILKGFQLCTCLMKCFDTVIARCTQSY